MCLLEYYCDPPTSEHDTPGYGCASEPGTSIGDAGASGRTGTGRTTSEERLRLSSVRTRVGRLWSPARFTGAIIVGSWRPAYFVLAPLNVVAAAVRIGLALPARPVPAQTVIGPGLRARWWPGAARRRGRRRRGRAAAPAAPPTGGVRPTRAACGNRPARPAAAAAGPPSAAWDRGPRSRSRCRRCR